MTMEISEGEEYLGLLREQQSIVQKRLKKADEQIGIMCDALHSDGITELSSNDEDISTEHTPSNEILPLTSLWQTHVSQVMSRDHTVTPQPHTSVESNGCRWAGNGLVISFPIQIHSLGYI